ncbi:MAG: TRAP transporter large permease [Pseudothermotoga sp.]
MRNFAKIAIGAVAILLLGLILGLLLRLPVFSAISRENAAITILFSSFALMMLLGAPIAFCLTVSSLLTMIYLKLPAMVVFQRMSAGINAFSLIAIPFFILAGQIMADGGIARRIVEFSNILIGRVRGGLAMVNILASMFFGGVSGSSVADTSSIGAFLIPMMVDQGYDRDFSVAVTITSSTQGIIIPPSHNMIIYSLAAGGVSVGALFMAGYIPGVMVGVAQMIVAYFISRKRNYPKAGKVSFKEALIITRDSILGLLVALIIIFGIAFGVFTATEASVIAAVYALVITAFVYKSMNLKRIIETFKNTTVIVAMVMFVIASSSAFGYLLAYLKIPAMVAKGLLSVTTNKYLLMLLINLILLFLGMIMDMAPLILITTPIFLPIVTSLGWSPIQFGIIMMLNLGIGLCTPPVGTTLFVGCAIGKCSIEKTTRACVPFYIAMIIVLLLVTYVPWFTMFLGSRFLR